MKNFKGYSLFNDVRDRKLQSFNRLQTMVNINTNMGEEQATHYVNEFSADEKKDLTAMALWIKQDGLASVQRQIKGE